VVAAETALTRPPAGIRTGGSGFASAPRGDSDATSAAPGAYSVYVTCAGTGHLGLTFTIGTATASATVPCSANPVRTHLPLQANTGGPTVTVVLEPDADATNNAGFAYYVAKDRRVVGVPPRLVAPVASSAAPHASLLRVINCLNAAVRIHACLG
jgi:hypothetical protein